MRPSWSPECQWAAVQAGDETDIVAIYNEQRARAPVAWRAFEDGQGHWVAFDYADCEAIVADPARFSSAFPKYGMVLIPIEIDPPEHAKYRVLLTKLINPKRMRRFEDHIRTFVRAQFARIRSGESSLLELTGALPIQTFCFVVGEADASRWKAISQAREKANDPRLTRRDDESQNKRTAANAPLVDYCQQQIAEHRANPRDDIVSDILAGTIDGRPITDDEALRMISLVYIAGHRTTTATLRGAVVQLARNPDALALLQADRGLISAAIEEIVRLETPIHGLPRLLTKDVILRGQTLRAGEQIFPNFGAANVDPAVFDAPGQFWLDRKVNRHLGFGMGLHHCAGAPLARLQLRILIEEIIDHVEGLDMAGPVQRMTWPHYGPVALPITVTFKP